MLLPVEACVLLAWILGGLLACSSCGRGVCLRAFTAALWGSLFWRYDVRVGPATKYASTEKRASAEEIGSGFFIRTVCSSLDSAGQIYMLGACMSIATFQPVREQL